MTDSVKQLFLQVLERRDLSRAGQLFSVEDEAIRFHLTELLRKIEQIVDSADYKVSANDQSVVEICVSRVLACIRDTNTIDQHIVAMVSLLETCASHNLASQADENDTPHTKLVRDLLGCIYMHSNHRLVLQLALPVTFKYLAIPNNPDLVRHVASYVSLASVKHLELVAQSASCIVDCVLQHSSSITRASSATNSQTTVLHTLLRLLPSLYTCNAQAIRSRMEDLLEVAEQRQEDSASRRHVLELLDVLAAEEPATVFVKTNFARRALAIYDDSSVELLSRLLTTANSEQRFADAFANDETIDQLQLAALRWPATRNKCVQVLHHVALRSKGCVAHCVAILIGLLLGGAPVSLDLATAILSALFNVLERHRADGDPMLVPAIKQLAELCDPQERLVPFARHSDVLALLRRMRAALQEFRCDAPLTSSSRRSVAVQTCEPSGFQQRVRRLRRTWSESCAELSGSAPSLQLPNSLPQHDSGPQTACSSVPNLLCSDGDVVNLYSVVPQPALNTCEQISAYVNATRHEIPSPCCCCTRPKSLKTLRKRNLPAGVLNLGVSEPSGALHTPDTSSDSPEGYSLFLQFRCEFASANCLYNNSADYFTIRTKHVRTWLHFHFLCCQAAAKQPIRLTDPSAADFRRACERTLLAKRESQAGSPPGPFKSPAELFPTLLQSFSTAFPSGRQISAVRREMANALYFDVFQYDRTHRVWTCFLCRQFLESSSAVPMPAHNPLLLNDGFADDQEVERNLEAACKSPHRNPPAPESNLSRQSRRKKTTEQQDTLVVLEGKVKEKRGYWSIFRRWKTRYFTLSGGHLLTIAASDDPSSPADLNPQLSSPPAHDPLAHPSPRTGSVTKKIQSFRPVRNRASRKPKAFEIFTNDQQKLLIKPDQRDAERWQHFLQTGAVQLDAQIRLNDPAVS